MTATDDVRRSAAPSAGRDGLSVILPAFNAAETIAPTIGALRSELRHVVSALEFIVVDDGSRDATAAVVTALLSSVPDVRLLRNRRNLGKGAAVYLGVLAARHAAVCFTDADLPFAPGDYTRAVQRVLAGAPLVVASRRLPGSGVRVPTAMLGHVARRHVVGVVFNALVRRVLGLPFLDTQCGLKAFRRDIGTELLRRMRSRGFLFDIELLLAARVAGVPVEEVPVCVTYATVKSTVRLTRDSAAMLLGLGRIAARHAGGRYRHPNPALDPHAVEAWTREEARAHPGSPHLATDASS